MQTQEFTIASTGDPIITRRISSDRDEKFRQLIDLIRDADASITNLEVTAHDFEGYPAAKGAGLPICTPPWILDELEWAGFDLLAAATNHAGDYSQAGMLATIRELEKRGIPYTGLGESLAEARAPAYFETAKGRVGLVSACTTIPIKDEAGEQRNDLQGRPGVSPLRWEGCYTLPSDSFDALRNISEELGLEGVKEQRSKPKYTETDDEFHFLNINEGRAGAGSTLKFQRGDEARVSYELNEDDADNLIKRIEEADRQAEWVAINLHSHEGANGNYNHPSVPEFLEEFARDCVDAGADIFISQGAHLLRGMEVYEGAPIFYSLGNFITHQETMEKVPQGIYDLYGLDHDAVPADVFDERYFNDSEGTLSGQHSQTVKWESVIPVCTFDDGSLSTIKLYPIELGMNEKRPRRGQPRLATGDEAERIIDSMITLSEPYATDITFEDGIGEVQIP